MNPHLKLILQVASISILFLFLMIQIFPYGRDHSNPPVINEPEWNHPETRATFMKACGDCHSNETKWPPYSHIAPVSWLIQDDVMTGRSHLNISEWGTKKFHDDEASENVQSGVMPLKNYLLLHPSANLTPDEKARFAKGLEETFGVESDSQSDE